MVSVLLAASPGGGMAVTMLPVLEALVQRGHDVTFLADEDCRHRIEARGGRFVSAGSPTPSSSDASASSVSATVGHRRFESFLRRRLLDAFDERWDLVQHLIAEREVDVIITDPTFFPAAAVAGLPREARPAVVALGGFPLPLADAGLAPYGFGLLPGNTLFRYCRNTVMSAIFRQVVLRRLNRDLRELLHAKTGLKPRGDVFDLTLAVDVWAQLTVPSFEYQRSRAMANLEFIGPLAPVDLGNLPEWWDPADERPIVHLRYEPGTDPSQLLLPSIEGLQDEEVLLVITGVAEDFLREEFGSPLPVNVRVGESVPYSLLLANAGAAIKAGDYVRTQYALRWGVPVVVAGTSEEHAETNARIQWTGVGVNLQTATPAPSAVRAAVLAVLADHDMRRAAARLAAEIANFDAEARICEVVEQVVLTRPRGERYQER